MASLDDTETGSQIQRTDLQGLGRWGAGCRRAGEVGCGLQESQGGGLWAAGEMGWEFDVSRWWPGRWGAAAGEMDWEFEVSRCKLLSIK